MKKILFAALAAITILTSCNKDEQTDVPIQNIGDMVEVELCLSQPSIVTTRSFFDEVQQYNLWDRSFSGIALYIFDGDGNTVFFANPRPASDFYHTVTVLLPRSLCGKTYRFYAMANPGNFPETFTTEDQLKEWHVMHTPGSDFNVKKGTDIYTVRSAIPMVGIKDVEVKPYGYKTFVEMPLERLCAKIALQLKLSDDFVAKHKGRITITEVTLRNYANSCYWIRQSGKYYSKELTSTTQTPRREADYFQNLWYAYETGADANPHIFIEGVFSGTGTKVEFVIPISEINGGAIDRNHFYRIDGTIKGVGDRNLDIDFWVRSWNQVHTDINIGE